MELRYTLQNASVLPVKAKQNSHHKQLLKNMYFIIKVFRGSCLKTDVYRLRAVITEEQESLAML